MQLGGPGQRGLKRALQQNPIVIRSGKEVEQLPCIPIRFLCRCGAPEQAGQLQRPTHKGAGSQHGLQCENLPACQHWLPFMNRPADSARLRVNSKIYHNA